MEFTKVNEQSFSDIFSGEGEKLTVQRSLLQGLDIKKLRGLFVKGETRSVYKLILNNLWEHGINVDFERGVRGAFGLVKATWGEEKGDENNKLSVEKIRVGEDTKAWLIMAQGQKNIYLMPVVRTSGWWGVGGCDGKPDRDGASIKVNKEGVVELGSWNFDNKKNWEISRDKNLQDQMKHGFSITRTIDAKVLSWKNGEHEIVGLKEKLEESSGEVSNDDGYLYKNAGILMSGGGENGRHGIYCSAGGEAYFPLDLVILGETSEKAETKIQTKIDHSKKEQTITINDTISEVIGVRLDKFLICLE